MPVAAAACPTLLRAHAELPCQAQRPRGLLAQRLELERLARLTCTPSSRYTQAHSRTRQVTKGTNLLRRACRLEHSLAAFMTSEGAFSFLYRHCHSHDNCLPRPSDSPCSCATGCLSAAAAAGSDPRQRPASERDHKFAPRLWTLRANFGVKVKTSNRHLASHSDSLYRFGSGRARSPHAFQLNHCV